MIKALGDRDPGVRLAAVGAIGNADAATRVQYLAGSLDDPMLSVRVEAAQHSAIDLGPGDELRVDGGSAPKRRKFAPETFTSWRQGELVFADTPLADALDRLGRYGREGEFRVQIGAEVAGLPVSGRVNVARAREWLAALPMALPVRVETAADGRIRIDGR